MPSALDERPIIRSSRRGKGADSLFALTVVCNSSVFLADFVDPSYVSLPQNGQKTQVEGRTKLGDQQRSALNPKP